MSGNGGSSPREVGTPGVGTPDDVCGSLRVETAINSPVAQVIRGLKVDDVLSVEIEISDAATRTKSLVAKDMSGRKAGSLTPPSLIAIINCIEDGFEYEAVVLEKVVGGLVRVRIQAKR
jgi:hypothetical protein